MHLQNCDGVATRLANLASRGGLPESFRQFAALPGSTAELCQRDLDRVVLLDRGDVPKYPDQDPRLGHVCAKNLGAAGYDLSASYILEGRDMELHAMQDYNSHQVHLSALRTKEGSAHVTIADSDGDCHIVITAENNGRDTTAFFSCEQLSLADQQWLLAGE